MYNFFSESTSKTLIFDFAVLPDQIIFVTLVYKSILFVMRGKVKWFDDKRGYGFITGDDGEDVYVHFTAISKDGYRTLKHNWRVSYDVELATDGRAEAHNVVVEPRL